MSAPHDVNPAQSSQVPDSAAEQAASAVDQSASAAEQDEFPQGQAPQTPVRGGPQPAVPRNPFATASLTFSLLSLGAVANMFAYLINFSLGFVFPMLVSIFGDNRRPRRTERRAEDGQHTQGLRLHGPRLRRSRPRDSLGRPLDIPVLRRSSMRRTRPTAPTGSRPLDGPSIAQVLSSSSSWQPEFLATRVLSSPSSWQSGFLVI